MIRIEATVKTNAFKFLWLKEVRDFDPTKHCARSFRGSYHPAFTKGDKKLGGCIFAEIDPGDVPFYYLCGVTKKWEHNLHVPMRPLVGSFFNFDDDNIRLTVTGAEMLPIPADNLPDLPKEFITCRNFQFGWHYFGHSVERQEVCMSIDDI